MTYVLFTTQACANECAICAVQDVPGLKIANIGRNANEQKGIENFLKSMQTDVDVWESLCLTSADPLRNLNLLELVDMHYHGEKQIVINPISFLTFELNKPASRITRNDVATLCEDVKANGLSSQSEARLKYLSTYSYIGISDGNLQSPNPEIMKFANIFFNNFIFPKLPRGTIKRNTLNGDFHGQTLRGLEKGLICVGKTRTSADKGEFPSDILSIAQSFNPGGGCHSDQDSTLYFQREDGETYLHYSICCAAGITPYVSTKSALSLEKMASMEPKEIQESMGRELEIRNQSALYSILNNPAFDDINNPDVVGNKLWWARTIPFHLYIQAAEELINEKSGKFTSIVNNTFTFNKNKECSSCEACYTIGMMLHRIGIKPQEWHHYLEERYPPENHRYFRLESKDGISVTSS